jgi:hypothetical protein
MIVDTGKTKLLSFQLDELAGCKWALFTSNTTIAQGTVVGDLTEAAWGGYVRVTAGTFNTPTLVSHVAVTTPTSNPVFVNTSGGTVTFYGWMLLDSAGTTLIAAVNLGATTIPNGGSFPLAPSVTDNQA